MLSAFPELPAESKTTWLPELLLLEIETQATSLRFYSVPAACDTLLRLLWTLTNSPRMRGQQDDCDKDLALIGSSPSRAQTCSLIGRSFDSRKHSCRIGRVRDILVMSPSAVRRFAKCSKHRIRDTLSGSCQTTCMLGMRMCKPWMPGS